MKLYKIFKTTNELELIVVHNKSNIVFEVNQNTDTNTRFEFIFDSDTFKELFENINKMSNEIWDKLEPKEANSLASDYAEYYDKQADNNGYLEITNNKLKIEGSSFGNRRIYKFNKRRIESFLFDFQKILYKNQS